MSLEIHVEKNACKVHALKSGATVLSLSAHPFQFSDGTVSEKQEQCLVEAFTLRRVFKKVGMVKGMTVNEMKMILTQDQLNLLGDLCKTVDLVILPFPVLTALREQGEREKFPNAVSFNATVETQRSAPNEKVIDINNWSY